MLLLNRQFYDESIPGLGIEDFKFEVEPGKQFYDDEVDYPWLFKEDVPNPVENEEYCVT